jgi:hypothetical protein
MSAMVVELYDALRKAGVDDELARAAARAVLGVEGREHLATKADLATLETSLIKWNVGTLLALSAIVSALVKLL